MPLYPRILVPVDGSATASAGLAEAIRLAQRDGSSIRLVHIVGDLAFTLGGDMMGATGVDVLGILRESGQALLDAAHQQVLAAGVAVDAVLRDGLGRRVCDLVVHEAQTWHADLIVIGTHGRKGPGRLLLGSDAEQILRLAPVPVLLVRAAGAAQPATPEPTVTSP